MNRTPARTCSLPRHSPLRRATNRPRLTLLALTLAITLRVFVDCHADAGARTGIDALIAASLCTTDPNRSTPGNPATPEPPLCLHCTTSCNAKLPPSSRGVFATLQKDWVTLNRGLLHRVTASSPVRSPPARGPPRTALSL